MIANTLRTASRTSLRTMQTRGYAAGQEPINIQRGTARSPFYIFGALAVLGIGYSLSAKSENSETSASKRMGKEATPKTDAAAEARNAGKTVIQDGKVVGH